LHVSTLSAYAENLREGQLERLQGLALYMSTLEG